MGDRATNKVKNPRPEDVALRQHPIGVRGYQNIKYESRNPKFETISNDQNPNDRNCIVRHSVSRMQIGVFVSKIGTLEF